METRIDFDPTRIRLSKHFLLSDVLGNHTVYSKGRVNLLLHDDPELPLKMANAKALCREILEPLLEQAGPFSISYGYISNEISREIVHYQDPDKPSHHQFTLGAAVDICVHEWVNTDPDDDTAESSPILLAHEINQSGYPYSRMITYAESPYICLACSSKEIKAGKPRKAFYEYRYSGARQPDNRTYSTDGAKSIAYSRLKSEGLEHGWRGQGYPSYHGGGRRQCHHIRISKYTMLSDFLFNLQSIANGYRNLPNIKDQTTMDSFYKAGDLYDQIIETTGINRFSIIEGYVHPSNPAFVAENDWTNGQGWFVLEPPENTTAEAIAKQLSTVKLDDAYVSVSDSRLHVHFQLQE